MFDYGKYVNLLRGKEDVLASNFSPVVVRRHSVFGHSDAIVIPLLMLAKT